MDSTKLEVLRYLGRQGAVPDDLNSLVDASIALMREASTFRQVRLTFLISSGIEGITLAGTDFLLRGNDIASHLSGCSEVVLMAATLGAEADALINRWKHADPIRSLILDACATQLIEEHCGEIERQIRTGAAASGRMATWRFSPGYGDLSLTIQPRLLEALNAGSSIGLTCTEHLILLPRKSVTALIGLGENVARSLCGCGNCYLLDSCKYRKDMNSGECNNMDKE